MPAGSIDGFELIEKIGQGGMAIVWKARQLSLDRVVAIKVLLPEYSSDPEETQSFVTEARSAAKLKHPGIVQVHDVANESVAYYFVMEHVSGSTLQQMLHDEGPLPSKKVLSIALDVAQALDYAWNAARMIHRDIKPENIMVDGDGTVKVADLGLSLQKTNYPSSHGYELEGTPNYMSPEQGAGREDTDIRSDMYSLGATLYHLVTGVLPFGGGDPMQIVRMHQTDHLVNPRDLNSKLPITVANLITKLMMKDKHDRYPDWPAVIQDIKKAMSGRIIVITDQEKARSTISPQRGKQAAAAGRSAGRLTPAAQPQRVAVSAPRSSTPLKLANSAPEEVAPPTARNKSSRKTAPLWAVSLVWLCALGTIGFVALSVFSPPPETPNAAVNNDITPIDADLASNPSSSSQASQPAAPAADPGSSSDQAAVNNLINSVMDNLLAEKFDTVLSDVSTASFQASGATRTEMRDLVAFIQGIQRAERAVEGSLIRKVGERFTTRTERGQPVVLEIHDISRGVIYASRVVNNNGQEQLVDVQIPISKYDVNERLATIQSRNTPADNAYKFILHMNAGNTDQARQLASDCGPFSEAFSRRVN
jgi:serine/threonine-protein kinase